MGLLLNRRRMMMGRGDKVIMTSASNPEVMAICYAQGWCASPDRMTQSEAEAVTNIGTVFRNSNIVHFDEFEYFTGVTHLDAVAFHNAQTLLRIILPNSLTSIGNAAFYSCAAITAMKLPSGITSIGLRAFEWCTGIATFTCMPMTAPAAGVYVFDNMGNYATSHKLRVPRGATGYDTGEWLNLQTRATAPYTLEYIDE